MILIDLNVLLDVIQQREPHYRASAAVLDQVIHRQKQGAVAGHAVTTIHYLVGRYKNNSIADQVVAWLLKHFSVAAVGHAELLRAQGLGWPDFEDAVVAAAAETLGCDCIITRNVRDFRHSPVSALTPDEYLLQPEPPAP